MCCGATGQTGTNRRNDPAYRQDPGVSPALSRPTLYPAPGSADGGASVGIRLTEVHHDISQIGLKHRGQERGGRDHASPGNGLAR
jgi:hypothetical protein